MAAEAALVARRLQEAQDSNKIDLMNCGLLKVPDALYIFLKNTPVLSCSMSQNKLKRIPPRFPTTFKNLQELILSDNNISDFPEEMCELAEIKMLDISRNHFTSIPAVVYLYTSLQRLILSHNDISDIDVDRLVQISSLQEVDLRGNPLSQEVRCRLLETNLPIQLDDG